MPKITKTRTGSMIGVWRGKLMEGEWYGDKIYWNDNGTWSGNGRWGGEDLSGKWKVKKGDWWSYGKDKGGWKGSGIGEVDSTIVEFKNSKKGILVVVFIAVISSILNIISIPLIAASTLGWITSIINIVIGALVILGALESTQRGKWQISGTWEDKEGYRVLYLEEGKFKLGYHEGHLHEANFNWEDLPGEDTNRFIDLMKWAYDIDWVKKSKIEKTDGGKTIRVYTEKNSLLLIFDKLKNEVKLDDGRICEVTTKMENGKLSVYEKHKLNIDKYVGSIK